MSLAGSRYQYQQLVRRKGLLRLLVEIGYWRYVVISSGDAEVKTQTERDLFLVGCRAAPVGKKPGAWGAREACDGLFRCDGQVFHARS